MQNRDKISERNTIKLLSHNLRGALTCRITRPIMNLIALRNDATALKRLPKGNASLDVSCPCHAGKIERGMCLIIIRQRSRNDREKRPGRIRGRTRSRGDTRTRRHRDRPAAGEEREREGKREREGREREREGGRGREFGRPLYTSPRLRVYKRDHEEPASHTHARACAHTYTWTRNAHARGITSVARGDTRAYFVEPRRDWHVRVWDECVGSAREKRKVRD